MKTAAHASKDRKIIFRFSNVIALFAVSVAMITPAGAQSVVKISTDTFTNTDSDHKTEVEPDSFAWGNTIVSAFHVGRRPGSLGWGSADVGFATSTNGGVSWKYGSLPARRPILRWLMTRSMGSG
jgi:hypothetical protein